MRTIKIGIAILLGAFGALSVFMTLSVLFDWLGIRQQEGHYIIFIVYTNLLCGLLYITASALLFKNINISKVLLALASAILIIAFIALLIFIDQGGVYELKTVNAMIFRIIVTIAITLTTFLLSKKENRISN